MSAKQLREAFAKNSRQSAVIELDGIGKIMIRELSLADLDMVDNEDTPNARAKNLALSIYTEDGAERVFNPDSQEDLDIIKAQGMRSIVNKITQAFTSKN
ncbi:MAG TPA: hypothetical protein VNQ97_13725 [Burkholderiaceae bacterium]|nr:hypothetical protein [Burkholderiaceae bacterium]